jgi:hypothetical protein
MRTLWMEETYISLDCLRVSCDLMILFFIYDEFTDNTDGDEAHAYADLVTDVLRNPHTERPQGESKIAEITRQYVRFSVRLSSASFN